MGFIGAKHYKIVCYNCGDVISQCRCMSKDKTIIKGTCSKCFKPPIHQLTEETKEG